MMRGGHGGDIFTFSALPEVGAGSFEITDLTSKDVIDLSAIDADSSTPGDQGFTLVHKFGGHAGEAVLSYDKVDKVDKVTHLDLDTNGDGVSDMTILIDGKHTTFDHFVL